MIAYILRHALLCRFVCAAVDWGAKMEGLPAVPPRLGHPLLVCSSGWHVRWDPCNALVTFVVVTPQAVVHSVCNLSGLTA